MKKELIVLLLIDVNYRVSTLFGAGCKYKYSGVYKYGEKIGWEKPAYLEEEKLKKNLLGTLDLVCVNMIILFNI